MTKLESLTSGARVRGLTPEGVGTVKSVSWHGDQCVEVICENARGVLDKRLVYRDDEPTLEIVDAGRPWSFDAEGHLFRLLSEAQRIHLAWLFDPCPFGKPA
jgi:hypothetical protein